MKTRLDQDLVQHGLIQSRERAKAMIMAGVVYVNGQKADKAGDMVKEDAVVEVPLAAALPPPQATMLSASAPASAAAPMRFQSFMCVCSSLFGLDLRKPLETKKDQLARRESAARP